MEKKHVEHLNKINQHWQDIFSNLLILNNINSDKVSGEIEPYIAQLALLPVSKVSVFSDMLWDYDWETRKRAASVTLPLVQLNFGQYQHIPLGVITEIKCLFLAVKASPKEFGHRKNEIKPNTLIAVFKGGLLFLDFVFSEVEKRLNKEYVHAQINKLSDISLLEYEEAAKKTTLKLKRKDTNQSTYKQFFEYLRTDNAKEAVGIECQVDYNAILKAYMQNRNLSADKKNEKIPYIETKIFDVAIRKASFNVVSFLKAMGEKVNDPVMEEHYEALATTYDKFPYSKQEYEDYGALRLWRKEYLIDYISEIFPDNKITKVGCSVEHQFKRAYSDSGRFGSYRIAFEQAYYSAIWVIGTLMGARPNVYSDLKIDCLDLEGKAIVAEERKGRDSRWNLFNDHWVVIPIMIDALKVIEMIGGKIFQNIYVFSSPNTIGPNEINKPLVEMRSFTSNSFEAVTGISRNNINTKINGYVFRHSLAHQMYRADVGLPIISYQLKHIVSAVAAFGRKGKVSQTTLGYGGIGSQLTKVDGKSIDIRHIAELEAVEANFDPNGKYMGGKAEEHVSNIKKFFNGYMEAGYSEDEIYEAMVEQGLAIINVGSGYCFGGVEDFDDTLPCIGGLRCNPVWCHNAVVTKANAPKWREIYLSNLKLIGVDGYEDRQDQIAEAIEESKRVLEYLGEGLI